MCHETQPQGETLVRVRVQEQATTPVDILWSLMRVMWRVNLRGYEGALPAKGGGHDVGKNSSTQRFCALDLMKY